MIFERAIVKPPCKNYGRALSSSNQSADYLLARQQHKNYNEALIRCGLEVYELPADESYPDSCFVEDTAVLTPEFAVLCNPGHPSRREEKWAIQEELRKYFSEMHEIVEPGFVDGGDIALADRHFFVGISERTNAAGGKQFLQIVKKYGYSGSLVPVEQGLHLKSGISYLEDGVMLTSTDFSSRRAFTNFRVLEVDREESYAANSLWINGYVLVPEQCPKTRDLLVSEGFEVISVPMTEFYNKDGGLSCLSLRF